MTSVGLRELKTAIAELPPWLRYGTILLPVVSFGVGYGTEWHVGNAALLLATLAGAQASVLAIVFSVTILGIQLISQEYSPRMIQLITKSPIFVFTFALFVFSVGVDLLLVGNISSEQSRILTGLIYAAAGMGGVAVLSLYAFIQSAINRLTPEGVIEAFLHELSPAAYYNQVQTNVESDTARANPLHPLYTIIMDGLSNRERVTVDLALEAYGHHTEELLTAFIEEDQFTDPPDDTSNQLFKPVLEDHLTNIALHAQETDESEVVSRAIHWQYQLGSKGLETPDHRVAQQAVRGLLNNIMDSPSPEESHAVSSNSWRRLGALLEDAADHPAPRIGRDILFRIEQPIGRDLWKEAEPWVYNSMWRSFYRAFRDSHNAFLEQYADDIADVDFDWQHQAVDGELRHSEVIELFDTFGRTYSALNADFLRYIAETGQYPITEGNYRENCYNVCIDASNSPAKEYARVLCQSLIEIVYIISCEKPDDESIWIAAVAHVKDKGDPDVVDAAFRNILSYQQQDEPGIWTLDERETYRRRYYQNTVQMHEYHPLNTHPDFPDRMERLQEQVDEAWEHMRSRE